MPSALDHTMKTPQTAIGKGTVGEPAPAPDGKDGLQFKVALFFDGTMNNRANTKVRIAKQDKILDEKAKDMLSSYANFYSNVAILEFLNIQREKKKQAVSVYVEGIGTVNYEEGAPQKDKLGQDATDRHGRKIIPTQDADISNDVQGGYAFGTGFTGIVDRVTQGIREAKVRVREAYDPDTEYVEKITIDVVGFSRGAAAARHFVSRYDGFRGVWPGQGPPALEINFVGLFETVSSYDISDKVVANGIKDLKGALFTKNVSELKLALGGVPKRVVHLTAQDEMRHNFSLTTIDSSLRAGGSKAFQVSLPGVHSDIGGGYVEVDPNNPAMDPTKTYPNEPGRPPIRRLNRENRRIVNPAEKRQLVKEGWYTDGTNGTPNQFHPVDEYLYARYLALEADRKEGARQEGWSYSPSPYTGEQYGSRYLTNQYQYVTLHLMLGMAQNKLRPGAHAAMQFKELTGENAIYDVPPDLVAVRNHFESWIRNTAADGKPDNRLDFATEEQGRTTRNKYLHRSSVLFKESTGGIKDLKTYFAYKRADKDTRVVFSDVDGVAEAPAVLVPELWNEEPKVGSLAEQN